MAGVVVSHCPYGALTGYKGQNKVMGLGTLALPHLMSSINNTEKNAGKAKVRQERSSDQQRH